MKFHSLHQASPIDETIFYCTAISVWHCPGLFPKIHGICVLTLLPIHKKMQLFIFSDLLGYSCISYLFICDSNLLSLGYLVLEKSSLSIIKWFQNHLLIWSRFYRLRQLCFTVGGLVSEQFSSNSGVEAVCPCFIILLFLGTRKEEKGFSNCKN